MVSREILNSHPVTTLRKEISKTNIKGYSKMKKAEVIQFVKGKKPMDKVLLAKLTKEAEKARKSNSKSKPDFDFDDDDTKLSKSNKSLALSKEAKAGGGDAMFKAVISKDGKTIHTSPLTNKKIGTIMDMTKPWNYKQGKNLKKFNINGKSLAMIGKGVKIEIKDRDGKVVKSRTI